jgi:hypothetical protein
MNKCVLCGLEVGHDEWCDRNPTKGQTLEYQCARVACAIPIPEGFGQYVDGTDGTRVGTNVATVEEWRQFFVTFLAQGVLAIEQSKSADTRGGAKYIAQIADQQKTPLFCRLGFHCYRSTGKDHGAYMTITGPRTIMQFKCTRCEATNHRYREVRT